VASPQDWPRMQEEVSVRVLRVISACAAMGELLAVGSRHKQNCQPVKDEHQYQIHLGA